MKYYFRLALLFSLIVIGKLTKEPAQPANDAEVSPAINPISPQAVSMSRPSEAKPNSPESSSRLWLTTAYTASVVNFQ